MSEVQHETIQRETVQRETIQRETMDVDILIVGGGVAGLSTAIHLQKLIEAHNAAIADGSRS